MSTLLSDPTAPNSREATLGGGGGGIGGGNGGSGEFGGDGGTGSKGGMKSPNPSTAFAGVLAIPTNHKSRVYLSEQQHQDIPGASWRLLAMESWKHVIISILQWQVMVLSRSVDLLSKLVAYTVQAMEGDQSCV